MGDETYSTKIRIEYSSITEAKKAQRGCGGWFAIVEWDKKILWYSRPYTLEEVFSELPSGTIVGTYSEE